MTERRQAGSKPVETFGDRVGHSIRALRRERGLTMQQLADAAGLSQAFVSQVERALVQPSLRSLDQLASVLNTTVVGLLADVAPDSRPHVSRADENVLASGATTGERWRVRPLVESSHVLQAIETTGHLPEPDELLKRRSDLLLYLADGGLSVSLGDEVIELRAGDCLFVPRGVPCGWHSVGQQEARFVTVTLNTTEAALRDAGLINGDGDVASV